MDLGIAGRTAVVTGGTRGIGAAVADLLEAEGTRVLRVARSEGIDVTAPDAAERIAEHAGGPVDILVNNAGTSEIKGLDELVDDDYHAAFELNVMAPMRLMRHFAPRMAERGWGRIVNVGSTSTREPIPGLNLSNAHRMAAVGFLKTLSREVAADGVTVNTVATGRFATERLADASGSLAGAEEAAGNEVPAARLGRPEEYGDLVAFLCSERAAYITGAGIPIDGGLLRAV